MLIGHDTCVFLIKLVAIIILVNLHAGNSVYKQESFALERL